MSKRMGLRSTFGYSILLRPDQLLIIKPDKKYPNLCHVKTTTMREGKNVWFTVKHSAKDILTMYRESK